MQILNNLRSNADVLIPFAILPDIDASQSLVEPGAYAAQRRMIVRVHHRPVLVLPELPYRGCSFLKHVSPTAVRRLNTQRVRKIAAPRCRERGPQILRSVNT